MSISPQQPETAVDVQWIARHLDDPRVRFVEVDVSRAAYDQGHIPGAILWNAYADLRDSSYRPVPPREMQRLLSRSGITPETTVVTYGYAAPLGFWLMKAHGHGDVRMLVGPREQWVEAGERWTTDEPRLGESPHPLPRADVALLAGRGAVDAAIDDPDQQIVDVRSELEYTGERFWPSGATADAGRPGHVPGAVSVPIDTLREANGAPRNVDELRRAFESAGVTGDKAIITYCTIGNRASEAWFALKFQLDYPRVRVYYDSWAVWGKLMDTPVAA